MNAKLIASIAVIAAAFCFVSVPLTDADQTITETWYVGDTLPTNYSLLDGTGSLSGSVPGVTFSFSGGFLIANGTPTTAGSYTVSCVYDDGEYYDNNTAYITVIDNTPPSYSFTLYYSANGGSGAPSTDTYTSTYSSPHSFTVSNGTPSRANYTFLGWSTSSSASTASYHGGDSISVAANSSKTLYAVWQYNTPTYTCTLNFNSNGSSVTNMPSTVSSTSSSVSQSLTIPNNVPVRSGYYFVGWNPDPNDPGATYAPGDNVTVIYSSPVTLNAIWKAISPADFNFTWTVNHALNNVQLFAATQDFSGSVPGVTFTISGGWVYANGTPTTDGTYNMYAVYDDGTGWEIVTGQVSVSTQYLTVTFMSENPDYGSIQPVTTLQVPYMSVISLVDNVLTVNNVNITAVPSASNSTYSYSFVDWSCQDGDVITVDTDISAAFDRTALSTAVHWSNDMMNGRVSMVLDWPSENVMSHNMTMKLYQGTVNADYSTTWNYTGYELSIMCAYPNTVFSFDLLYNGVSVDLGDIPTSVTTGKWSTYELTINADEGKVVMTPVKTFNNFLDYTLLESQRQTIFDFSSFVSNTAVTVIDMEDTGSGDHVRFSVTNTNVFLNTYGVVMTNPTINVYNYFPQYEKVRVSFYSFALYGSSITVNGITYILDGADITIQYVDDAYGNHLIPALNPDLELKEKTFSLNNIQVTWDSANCYLTFASERFTLNLGAYSDHDETVAFTGIWYFTSAIFEPTTSTSKELGPWKVLPDLNQNQMVLIFLGLLVIVGSAAYVKLDGSIIDATVIACAGLITLFLLG